MPLEEEEPEEAAAEDDEDEAEEGKEDDVEDAGSHAAHSWSYANLQNHLMAFSLKLPPQKQQKPSCSSTVLSPSINTPAKTSVLWMLKTAAAHSPLLHR